MTMDKQNFITAYDLLNKQKDTGKREHRFVSKECGEWKVYCEETTGSFYTSIWTVGKCPRQQCPYCGKLIRRW